MARTVVPHQSLSPCFCPTRSIVPVLQTRYLRTGLPHLCPGQPSRCRRASIRSSPGARNTTLGSRTRRRGRRPRHTPSRPRGRAEHCSTARRPGGRGSPPPSVYRKSSPDHTVEGASRTCRGTSPAWSGKRRCVEGKGGRDREYGLFQAGKSVRHESRAHRVMERQPFW